MRTDYVVMMLREGAKKPEPVGVYGDISDAGVRIGDLSIAVCSDAISSGGYTYYIVKVETQ